METSAEEVRQKLGERDYNTARDLLIHFMVEVVPRGVARKCDANIIRKHGRSALEGYVRDMIEVFDWSTDAARDYAPLSARNITLKIWREDEDDTILTKPKSYDLADFLFDADEVTREDPCEFDHERLAEQLQKDFGFVDDELHDDENDELYFALKNQRTEIPDIEDVEKVLVDLLKVNVVEADAFQHLTIGLIVSGNGREKCWDAVASISTKRKRSETDDSYLPTILGSQRARAL